MSPEFKGDAMGSDWNEEYGMNAPASLSEINDGLSQSRSYELDGGSLARTGEDGLLIISAYKLSERQETALLSILLTRSVISEKVANTFTISDILFTCRLLLHYSNPANKTF